MRSASRPASSGARSRGQERVDREAARADRVRVADALGPVAVAHARGDQLEVADRPVGAVGERDGQRDAVVIGLDLLDGRHGVQGYPSAIVRRHESQHRPHPHHAHRQPAPARRSHRAAGGAGHRHPARPRRLRGARAPGGGRRRPGQQREAGRRRRQRRRAGQGRLLDLRPTPPHRLRRAAAWPACGPTGPTSPKPPRAPSGARPIERPACNGPIDWKDRDRGRQGHRQLPRGGDRGRADRGVHDAPPRPASSPTSCRTSTTRPARRTWPGWSTS